MSRQSFRRTTQAGFLATGDVLCLLSGPGRVIAMLPCPHPRPQRLDAVCGSRSCRVRPNIGPLPERLRVRNLPAMALLAALLLLQRAAGRDWPMLGWAMVVDAQSREFVAVVESLPAEAKDIALRAAPMPDKVRLGKVLESSSERSRPSPRRPTR